jgi:hypothetical protein
MSRKRKTNQQTNAELLKTKDERIAELEKQLAQAMTIIADSAGICGFEENEA